MTTAEQSSYRMPATGEAWRHYKGGYNSLYTVIGMSRDHEGNAVVVYTPYNWTLATLAPIYNQPLSRFIQEVPTAITDCDTGKREMKPRFLFEREPSANNRCQYIRSQWCPISEEPQDDTPRLVSDDPYDRDAAHMVTLTPDGKHFNSDVIIEEMGTTPTHWHPVP